ncbi:tyrosine-type recombinase/integrase [Candidatus Uhrbacteria bacterium]|nr:tyrosine-type recombinase/integrase [Candidatus Uhrbacteria bacterium]
MKDAPLPQLDDFLLHIQTHNYSEETLYNYERDLAVFESFLAELNCDFDNVTKKVIEQYKAYLTSRDRKTVKQQSAQKKLGSGSINRALSSLRSYMKYLIEMDYSTPLPPEAIRLIRTERKHPQVAELDELVKLIEAPSMLEKKKIIALRNRAIMEVLFSTGMRISELVSIKRIQIDTTGRIFIRGKGKKERFVYLTPRAYRHIKNYLLIRADTNPNLFIPYRGMNVSSAKARISTNYVQERIKKYRELLGINIPISAHSLRHGFATYLAESGANPAAIQILLGHESLDTTTRYVHASDRYAQKTHQTYHPLKK